MSRFCAVTFWNWFSYLEMCMQSTINVIMKTPRRPDIQYATPFCIRPEEALFLLLPIRRLWWPTDLASDFRHALHQNGVRFSGAATMLFMLLFLIFYSPLACYNVYRFVASSLFSCCPIILYVIYAYYSCVDGTEIKDTN